MECQFLTEEYERGLFLSYLRRYKSAMKNYLPSHNSLFNRNPPPSPPSRLNIMLYGMQIFF